MAQASAPRPIFAAAAETAWREWMRK